MAEKLRKKHVKARCLHGIFSGCILLTIFDPSQSPLSGLHWICQDGRRVPCLFLPFQHVTWDESDNLAIDGRMVSTNIFFKENLIHDSTCSFRAFLDEIESGRHVKQTARM